MLLFNRRSSDGKNVIQACELFAVLFSGKYSARLQESADAYDHGSRSRISPTPYVALDFATLAIRASEGAFVLMQITSPSPTRTWSSVARAILQITSGKTLDEIRPSGLDRGISPSRWAGDAAQISAALFKSFAETGSDRVIFSNFATWASGDIPSEQRGFNFENMYYAVSSDPDEEGKMQCDRRAKSPARNCYAFAPVKIDYRVPDLAVVRMEDSSRQCTQAQTVRSRQYSHTWRLLPVA